MLDYLLFLVALAVGYSLVGFPLSALITGFIWKSWKRSWWVALAVIVPISAWLCSGRSVGDWWDRIDQTVATAVVILAELAVSVWLYDRLRKWKRRRSALQ